MSRQIKDGKKTQRGQKKTRAEVETRIDAEANEVWKGHLNLDNFIVIREDIPNSLEVKISMGFKNPTVTENTSKTITGQNLYVDWFPRKRNHGQTH